MLGVYLVRFDRTIDTLSSGLPTTLSSTDVPVFCTPMHADYMRGLILMEGVKINLHVLEPGKQYELSFPRKYFADMPRFYSVGIHPDELYWDVGPTGHVGMDNHLPQT